ncbi:MAG: SUMF1/EgtB/PvdO family nonheme iron enzyme [Neomegalonema sp.]|nr:SUMF1/EgtB/PvdO family nonheme iron enzyme [Neomegalonema sp.]
MAEIFISYKSERRPAARHLSKVLEQNGFSVWYDYGLLPGEDFEKRLMRELAQARIVIVLWCEMSKQSQWVQKEATEAKAAGKLLPTRIQTIDYASLPEGFWRDDIVALADWDGDPLSQSLDRLLEDIGRRLGRDPAPQFRGLRALREDWQMYGQRSLADFALSKDRLKPDEEAGEAPSPTSAQGVVHDPAAERWARIEQSLDTRLYTNFIEVFPTAPQTFEAKTHRMQLEDWAAVDQSDLAAVRAFERTLPFAALAHEVRRVAGALEDAVRRDEEEAARCKAEEEARRQAEAEAAQRAAAAAAARKAELERGFPHLSVFRDRLRSGGEGPEMVVIPEGEFMMGSPADEPERSHVEGPQHLVTIANRFALGKYAVTFDEYDAYCAASGAAKPEADFGRGRMPVINVSWDDAQGYCSWLSELTGAAYRLPSEAEWEYACRGQCSAEAPSTPFWWGREITPDQANYDGNCAYDDNYAYEDGGRNGVYREQAVAVDFVEFKANPFGLHQMHGNVREWCEDAWNNSYNGAPDDGSAWLCGDTSRAIFRGGSWNDLPYGLRSANRFRDHRDVGGGGRGFRIARTIIPS